MRVIGSEIALQSARSFVEKNEASEKLEAWVGKRPSAPQGASPSWSKPVTDKITLSDEMKNRLEGMKKNRYLDEGRTIENDVEAGSELFIKKLLIEAMTGHEIKVHSVEKTPSAEIEGTERAGTQAAGDGSEGWGFIYNSEATHIEEESMTFTASGTIKTADGQEIAFNLDLSMSSTSITKESLSLRGGDAKKVDPLVINFSGKAADLSNYKFKFDIDSDGKEDDIFFVGTGNGFLVLDFNKDGKVNDGRELFGPSTGNGFNELCTLDSDHNSWIDENDAAYNDLKIWTKDAQGNDRLVGLKAANVGAIYLSSSDARFGLKTTDNVLGAEVVRSGVYLKEDGNAGTVQQIDLIA